MSGSLTPTYEFSPDVQSALVSCLVLDSDFHRRVEGMVKPEYLADECEQKLFEMAADYFEKYHHLPASKTWFELVKEWNTKGRLRKELARPAMIKLLDLMKLVVADRAWLMDKTAEFAKQQAITNAMLTAAPLIERGGDPERFDKIEQLLGGAFQISLPKDDDEDYDFFERIAERTKVREDIASGKTPPTGVTTGIAELDSILLHRGWGREELSLLMGGAKSTKSFHLTFFGGKAVLAGKNVIIFTFENSRDITANRLDAMFSGVGISDQFRSPVAMEAGVRGVGSTAGIGALRIVSAPMGSYRPRDIRRKIDQYKAKGLTFDLCVVDYLGVMAPDRWVENHIENSKSIAMGLRAIAQQEKFAMLSAVQLNREGHKSVVGKAEHVAEDFNLVRLGDLVLAINRTDDEKAAHKSRITFAASRNQSDGATLFCTQDLEHGLAIASVDSVE